MTSKPSQTSGFVRRASLDDATPVQVPMNGITRTILRNQRTGEHFYSICSEHWNYDPDCDNCHRGGWAYPVRDYSFSEENGL